jgi:hypothetical protein
LARRTRRSTLRSSTRSRTGLSAIAACSPPRRPPRSYT